MLTNVSRGKLCSRHRVFFPYMTPSNKRMHATADTAAFILRQWGGAARDAGR